MAVSAATTESYDTKPEMVEGEIRAADAEQRTKTFTFPGELVDIYFCTNNVSKRVERSRQVCVRQIVW